METWNWTNLWSGGAGAVLGALASIGILIGTNWWTRRMNQVALADQAAHFELEQENARLQFKEEQAAARDRFNLEQAAGKESARESRELDVVAELLTWLQIDHDRAPLSCDLTPELMSICNRLILNSAAAVADAWRGRSAPSHRLTRVDRHPLAHALVPWASAYFVSQNFPDTMSLLQPREGESVVSALSGADRFRHRSRIAVELISRQMLRWSYLTTEEKARIFDPLIETAKLDVDRVFAAVNYSLGSNWDGDRPYYRLQGQRVLTEHLMIMKEIGDVFSAEGVDDVLSMVGELGGLGWRPDDRLGMWVFIDEQPGQRLSKTTFMPPPALQEQGDFE